MKSLPTQLVSSGWSNNYSAIYVELDAWGGVRVELYKAFTDFHF